METLQKLHKSFIGQIYKVEKILTYRSNTAGMKKKCMWSVLTCIIFWEQTFGKLFRTSAAHLSTSLKRCSKMQRERNYSVIILSSRYGKKKKKCPLSKGALLIANPVTWELLNTSESPTMVPQVPLTAGHPACLLAPRPAQDAGGQPDAFQRGWGNLWTRGGDLPTHPW